MRSTPPHHHPEPDPHLAFVHHLLHAIDRPDEDPASWNVVMPFDSTSSDASSRRGGRAPPFLGCRGRLAGAALDQPLRGLAQEAGRVTVRVPQDLSAGGALCRPGCPTAPSPSVGERGVAARVHEQHGIVRRHLVERRVRRKPLDVRRRTRRPLLLVPAAAVDPLTRLRGARRLADHRDDLVPRSTVHQVEH